MRLNQKDRLALTKILTERAPDLVRLVEVLDLGTLDSKELESMRASLADELFWAGIDDNGVVNERGATAEELMGKLPFPR